MRSLPVIFAAGGLLLFALAFWRASLQTRTPEEARAVARLEPVYGELWMERDGRREKVDRSRALQRLTTIGTAAETEALLSFASGEQVRLLENSLVLIDWEAGRPVLVVKDGDLWPEKTNNTPDAVLVSREGVRRSLADDLRERQDRGGQTRPLPDAPAPVKATARSNDESLGGGKKGNETLNAEYIQSTLRIQRNAFFKCYTQLLQKTPGVSGEASLAFTIERTGRVSQADVSSSSVQDPQFRRCLTESVKRIEFKSFAGEPISAIFPVRFE